MAMFLLFNVTQDKHFPFPYLDEAQEKAASDVIGEHDDWVIVEVPEQVGARAPVDQGRGPRR
jgi:hypothetical protein